MNQLARLILSIPLVAIGTAFLAYACFIASKALSDNRDNSILAYLLVAGVAALVALGFGVIGINLMRGQSAGRRGASIAGGVVAFLALWALAVLTGLA